jgi:hypothetical protein
LAPPSYPDRLLPCPYDGLSGMSNRDGVDSAAMTSLIAKIRKWLRIEKKKT